MQAGKPQSFRVRLAEQEEEKTTMMTMESRCPCTICLLHSSDHLENLSEDGSRSRRLFDSDGTIRIRICHSDLPTACLDACPPDCLQEHSYIDDDATLYIVYLLPWPSGHPPPPSPREVGGKQNTAPRYST